MSKEEYNRIVYDAYKHKENFEISCSSEDHKQHILSLMEDVKCIVVDKVEYYIGKKYQILIYNLKTKNGDANFNNKGLWNGIKNIMERNR